MQLFVSKELFNNECRFFKSLCVKPTIYGSTTTYHREWVDLTQYNFSNDPLNAFRWYRSRTVLPKLCSSGYAVKSSPNSAVVGTRSSPPLTLQKWEVIKCYKNAASDNVYLTPPAFRHSFLEWECFQTLRVWTCQTLRFNVPRREQLIAALVSNPISSLAAYE